MEDKSASTESPFFVKPYVDAGEKSAMAESPATPRPTIRLVSDDDGASSGDTTPKPEPLKVSTPSRRATLSHTTSSGEPDSSSSSSPAPLRQRSNTVIQRILIEQGGRAKSDVDGSPSPQLQRKGSLVVKAVTIPAWQFFRLMRTFTCPFDANLLPRIIQANVSLQSLAYPE